MKAVVLTSYGEPATGRLAKLLGDRGTLVAYAAPSFSPMAVSPLEVIFHDLTIRGFSLGNPAYAKHIAPAIRKAASMIAAGEVTIHVAGTYPLEEIGAAIAHTERGGKVLLEVGGTRG
jgi:NADPH:quinone reductase-like Zn-dependent oxidoreductase